MAISELERQLRRAAKTYERAGPVVQDLEQRIRVRVAITPRQRPRGLTAIVLKPRGRSARRRLRIAVALPVAALLVVIGNLGGAYYAPGYGRVMAGAPLIGVVSRPLLKAFGLTEGSVTAVNDVSVSDGHSLRLVAGYADELRTVLFVGVDGKGLTGNPKQYGRFPDEYVVGPEGVTLTDQFGYTYSGGGTGGAAVQFEPLAWPASAIGARLTLHVTTLLGYWTVASGGQPIEVHGNWTLHATLVEEPRRSLPLPQPVKTADAVYAFTSIRATHTEVQIHWTVSGSPNAEMHRLIDGGHVGASSPGDKVDQLTHGYFWGALFDEAGNRLSGPGFGSEFPKDGPARGDMDMFIPGPGRYRIQLGDNLTAPEDQRWIVVP